eukprot:m.149742 g.149742  ORF g.149742 m.149742 type:complete len:441 (+) comp14249_c0_seq1:133-1455(+)
MASKAMPGPYNLAEILRRKVEVTRVLNTFFANTRKPGPAADGGGAAEARSDDREAAGAEAALAMQHTEQRYYEVLGDIYRLRQAGGIFPCSFRAVQLVEGDAVVVTRQGRFIMTQGHELSVILPDELLSVTNKAAKFRRGGFQRRDAEHSYAFMISWLRVRPDQPPLPTRTQVFMEEHGAEFEAVTRHVLGRRRQCKWRQIHALAERAEDLRATFDPKWEPHRNALFSLWDVCFPGVPPPPLQDAAAGAVSSSSRSCDCAEDGAGVSWTALGFPSEAPHSLLGSTGVLGIKHLQYYAATRPITMRSLLNSDLKFAVLGITVTQALALLGFDSARTREPLPIAKPEEGPSPIPLARMLHNVSDPTALEQVFRLVLDMTVDKMKRQPGNGMAAHSDVVLEIQRSLLRCLDKLPTSIEELTVMMHARQQNPAPADIPLSPERA